VDVYKYVEDVNTVFINNWLHDATCIVLYLSAYVSGFSNILLYMIHIYLPYNTKYNGLFVFSL
jgi:hypothetical protein